MSASDPILSDPSCVGVFDSGVGGLTVLRELRRQMPGVSLRYVADTANAPYGQRNTAFITERSLVLAQHLLESGARLLVVACNTATAHAIGALRQRWPDLPIVGTEPGIKPAVAASLKCGQGRIGVMATPATIASARYQDLLSRHADGLHIISQPCPGLADLIETGDFTSPAMHALLHRLCAPLREAKVDTVLMGCTHYPLIQTQLQAELGAEVQLLNIETAVAQQAARLWASLGLLSGTASIQVETTGSAAALTRFMHSALGWHDLHAESLAV